MTRRKLSQPRISFYGRCISVATFLIHPHSLTTTDAWLLQHRGHHHAAAVVMSPIHFMGNKQPQKQQQEPRHQRQAAIFYNDEPDDSNDNPMGDYVLRKTSNNEMDSASTNKLQIDVLSSLQSLVRNTNDQDLSAAAPDDRGLNRQDTLASITRLMEAYVSQREQDKNAAVTRPATSAASALRYNESSAAMIAEYMYDDDWGTDDDEDDDTVLSLATDAMFLDEDGYLEASSRVGKDGSILLDDDDKNNNPAAASNINSVYQTIASRLAEPAPNSPSVAAAEESSRKKQHLLRRQQPRESSADLDMQQAWEALVQQTRNQETMSMERLKQEAQELRQQVFAQEEGFLQQSKVFRRALVTNNETLVRQAATHRHGRRFRKKQSQAVTELAKKLDEFENELLQQPPTQNEADSRPRCVHCACLLAPHEIEQGIQKDGGIICQLCLAEDLVVESRQENNRRRYTGGFDGSNANSDSRSKTFRPNLRLQPLARRTSSSAAGREAITPAWEQLSNQALNDEFPNGSSSSDDSPYEE